MPSIITQFCAEGALRFTEAIDDLSLQYGVVALITEGHEPGTYLLSAWVGSDCSWFAATARALNQD